MLGWPLKRGMRVFSKGFFSMGGVLEQWSSMDEMREAPRVSKPWGKALFGEEEEIEHSIFHIGYFFSSLCFLSFPLLYFPSP